MNALKIAMAIVAVVPLSACVTTQAYVDPEYHHATFSSLQRPAEPIPVVVSVQWERNGVPYPAYDSHFQSEVVQTLGSSGVFAPVLFGSGSGVNAQITIVGNDIYDASGAFSKGFGTGLTFGAVGNVVSDNYEFTFAYRNGSDNYQNTYRHAILTTVGNAAAPVAAPPTTPADASHQVIQDVTLNFVDDLQKKGLLNSHQ